MVDLESDNPIELPLRSTLLTSWNGRRPSEIARDVRFYSEWNLFLQLAEMRDQAMREAQDTRGALFSLFGRPDGDRAALPLSEIDASLLVTLAMMGFTLSIAPEKHRRGEAILLALDLCGGPFVDVELLCEAVMERATEALERADAEGIVSSDDLVLDLGNTPGPAAYDRTFLSVMYWTLLGSGLIPDPGELSEQCSTWCEDEDDLPSHEGTSPVTPCRRTLDAAC